MIATTVRPLLVPLLLLATACGTSRGSQQGLDSATPAGSRTVSVAKDTSADTAPPPSAFRGTDEKTIGDATNACSVSHGFTLASVKSESTRPHRGDDYGASRGGRAQSALPTEAEVNACAAALATLGFRVCTVNVAAGAIVLPGKDALRVGEMPACVKEVKVYGMVSPSGVAGVTN